MNHHHTLHLLQTMILVIEKDLVIWLHLCIIYKIKEHLTNKELSDKRELSSNVVVSEEYLVDLEQTLGSHHNKMVMNKYVEFFMNEYNNNRSVEFLM